MIDRPDSDETDEASGDDEKPDWWRAAIDQHREYDLLPYEPPRLADGTLKHRVVTRLEDEYEVDIQFIGVDVTYGDNWEIRVDSEVIETVAHERSPEGYSVYHIESDELAAAVRSHVV